MHQVSESELNNLADLGTAKSVPLAFAMASGGVFFTLIAVLLTTPPAESKVFAAFWAVVVVTFFIALYFGIQATRAFSGAKRKLRDYLAEDEQ